VNSCDDLESLLERAVSKALAAAKEQELGKRLPDSVTIKQVAGMLGICERSVRRRWYDGTFPPPQRFGRSIRWRRLDIENMKGDYSAKR
jgi:predicted DNA-binding transcriptional regulator AlpA